MIGVVFQALPFISKYTVSSGLFIEPIYFITRDYDNSGFELPFSVFFSLVVSLSSVGGLIASQYDNESRGLTEFGTTDR